MNLAKQLAAQLRQSEARAEAIQRASLDAIVLIDHEGRFLEFNPAAERLFGYTRADVIGRQMADFIVPARLRPSHHNGMTRYLATGSGPVVNQRVELPALRASGEEFPAEIAIVPIEGETAPVFVGFIRDISERKQAEQRQTFLLDELGHRSKNLLTVVQAIVHRTLKDHPPEQAGGIIDRRLAALSRSHLGLLTNPAGAALSTIVQNEVEGFSARVSASGPELYLKASAAQTLALVLHELATNATKHGALAAQSGHVTIAWRVSAETPKMFFFEWRETADVAIKPPTHKGFGRIVLEQMAANVFEVTPEMEFAPEGLRYRLNAPLAALTDA